MEMKRKRSVPPEAEEDAIARSLAAYGERFMQMFSDADERMARAAGASSPAYSSCPSGGRGSEAGTSSEVCTSSEDDEDSGASSGPEAAGGAAEFVFDSQTVRRLSGQQQQQRARARQKAQLAAAATPPVDAKLERKAFMSSKAGKVHSAGAATAAAAAPGRRGVATGVAAEEENGSMTREEFLKMQREVELYGAAALDKRSRKRFEAAMLSKLGAKAQRSPRIPAKIGLGMAKKAAQREARALEAAIDAGMVKRKGLGKRKREEKRKSLDRGLMEDRGAFKAGVMRVKLGAGGGSGGRGR